MRQADSPISEIRDSSLQTRKTSAPGQPLRHRSRCNACPSALGLRTDVVGSAHRCRPRSCDSRRLESLPRQCEFRRAPECQTSRQRRNPRWHFGLVRSHVATGASMYGSLTTENIGKVALPSDAIAASLIKPDSSVTKTSEMVPLSATLSAIFSSPIRGASTGFLVGQAFQPDIPDVRLESLTYSKNVRLESLTYSGHIPHAPEPKRHARDSAPAWYTRRLERAVQMNRRWANSRWPSTFSSREAWSAPWARD